MKKLMILAVALSSLTAASAHAQEAVVTSMWDGPVPGQPQVGVPYPYPPVYHNRHHNYDWKYWEHHERDERTDREKFYDTRR